MDQPDALPAAPSPAPAPMKFSRYRSVRRAASKKPQEIISPAAPPPLPLHSYPPPPPSPRAPPSPPRDMTMASNGTPTTIQRSMSRYRRQRAPPSSSSSESTPLPPVPASTGPSDAPARGAIANSATSRPTSREVRRRAAVPNPFLGEDEEDETELERQREQHRQNAMSKLTGETSKPTRPTPRPATREKSVKYREGRSRHADRHAEERPRRPSHDQQPQPQPQPQQQQNRRSWKEMAKSLRPKEKRDSGEHTGTRFPGLDAPVSAVNAGERKVTVQYKKMSTELTVLPSTSVQDLLFSAAEALTSDIDPVKFILMESFAELGLERPLRRYESIRDVLNSWAHDSENVLIVVPPASLDALALLDAHRVPTQHPTDVTLHLYYSQRPRKWDKRYITLRADGQITVSKKEDGQDQANVCHLSDFDIYSPTASFLSHNVKPPKKICHAIKSQQKSSMFLSTENFVHFFATNDRAIADRWYRAVQTWRSWYMVHTLGAGQQDEQVDSPTEQSRQPSRPLLNMTHGDSFNSEDSAPPALDRSKSTRTKDLFARKKSTREHAPPPPALPRSFADDSDTTPDAPGDSPFISTGLLGRTYTLRQRAMKEREDREKKAAEEPFVAQGLVGTMSAHPSRPNTRSNTMTSTRAPPDTNDFMKRSQSQKVKPLVDLTPVYQEPPQHIRKGKGVAVEPGQPLIESATGLDPAGGIAIPPATTWRRQPPPPPLPDIPADINVNGNINATRTRQRSNTARSTSNHRPHRIQTSTAPASPIDPSSPRGEEAFVPNSLIARSALQGQCGMIRGHGVATGDRNAAKPMLDVAPENPFAEGSLLRGL